MGIFDWDEKFATGNTLIDTEHQRLFAFAGSLDRATHDDDAEMVVGPFLSNLIEYTETHYRHEEALMREVDYPDIAAHQRIHDDLRSRARALETSLGYGKSTITTELMAFVKEMLLRHIAQEDKRIADHIRKRASL